MPGCHKNILLILVLTLAMAVSQPFAAVNVYAEPSGSDGESVLEAPAQTAVPDVEEADNDELFEEYIERELQESLPSSGKRLLKAGKTKLSGTNLALYNVLKA